MRLLMILVSLAAVGCAQADAASPTAPTPVVAVSAPVSARIPDPVPAPPVAAPTIAPCSVRQPPAPNTSHLLLCVTGDGAAVSGADVNYEHQSVGMTDDNGQFLLTIRGYGGYQRLVVTKAGYRRSPVTVDLALREEHVSETIDLGPQD